MKLLDAQEIVVSDMNWTRANAIINNLVEEGYVTMVSVEEELIVINFIDTYPYGDCYADRNCVVFMRREDFENNYCELNTEDDDNQ